MNIRIKKIFFLKKSSYIHLCLEPIVVFFTRGTPNICGISTRLYIPFNFDVVLFLPVLHCFQFRHAFNTFNYLYNLALPAFETSLNKTRAGGHITHVSVLPLKIDS